MDARRAAARAEAQPHYDAARKLESRAAAGRKQLAALRKAGRARSDEYKALQAEAAALSKEARQLRAKGEALEAAVYDLKAVNPNRAVTEDTRTPEELIALIEAKGREVATALAALKG